MKYTVFVDDNFHPYDEEERTTHGEYDSVEEAIAESKGIVDRFLSSNYKPGISAEEFIRYYKTFGSDPFIFPSDGTFQFSAWGYAEQRCRELCGEKKDEASPV
jgi:hypothetical protein